MEQTEHQGLLVGLTGQTGSGKSTVCTLLLSRGFMVIDADVVARQVVEHGEQCLLDLAIEFGIEILNIDGTLNRKKLAEIVFSDKEKRMRLNEITHPFILVEIKKQADRLLAKGEHAVFLDAPTLFESGGDALCDKIVSVIAPVEYRLSRIMSRDGLTEREAILRIRSQYDDAFYMGRSHYTIQNDSDLSALRVMVMEMLDRINVRSKG